MIPTRLWLKRPVTGPLVTNDDDDADARILEEVKKAAVARFWELVIDFVQLRVAPLGWSQSIPLDHPILRPTDNRLAMQLAPRVGI